MYSMQTPINFITIAKNTKEVELFQDIKKNRVTEAFIPIKFNAERLNWK